MNQKRPGFTLVELLVVITIIGILMGLLIPAVNSARESARRNQCGTQIKNLALAAIQHENTKGELPAYVRKYGFFGTPGATAGTWAAAVDPSDPSNYAGAVPPHVKVGTWAVALLPWLDAQPSYEHWTEDRYPIIHNGASGSEHGQTSGAAGDNFHTLSAPNLAIMQCPSNPVSQGEHAKNSYIANNGMAHLTNAASPGVLAVGFGLDDSQSKANGAFVNAYNVTGLDASGGGIHTLEGDPVRLDDFKDGQGNTMLFSENVQALPWNRPGLVDASDIITAAAANEDVLFSFESARYIHGMVWHYADPKYNDATLATLWGRLGTAAAVVPQEVESFLLVNGGGATVSDEIFTKTIANTNDARKLARPSSAHVEGVNAGMADGGTRFINSSIDYRVYQALLTPRGKSSDVPWPEYILDPEAL